MMKKHYKFYRRFGNDIKKSIFKAVKKSFGKPVFVNPRKW